MKIGNLSAGVGLAFVVLLVALGTASAADQWIVLGEKVLKSTDPSTEITAEEGKMFKEDIKKAKISVEGADVEIQSVVFRWNNRPDETVANVGVVKSGGFTAEKDAPGHEATLCRWPSSTRSSTINRRPPSKFGDTTERNVNTGQRTCSRDQRANGKAIRVHVRWRSTTAAVTSTSAEASADRSFAAPP